VTSLSGRSTQGPPPGAERRVRFRRAEDADFKKAQNQQGRQLRSLLELSQLIGSDLRLESLLYQVAQKARALMAADRCSIFLYNLDLDVLWTTVAIGIDGKTICLPAHEGLVGHCFQNSQLLNLKDAYEDPRFNREVDVTTGYRTRSVLCLPIFTRDHQKLGVIQLLNKEEGTFTEEDETFLRTYANHAAVFLEIAQLQKAKIEALEYSREELRRLNRAKDKALDRLSHELRTPLSVIQGNIRILKQRLQKTDPPPVGIEFFRTLEKHLSRLSEIQEEADAIIRFSPEKAAENLLLELKEKWQKLEDQRSIPLKVRNHWEGIREWMDGAFLHGTGAFEEVPLYEIAEKVVIDAKGKTAHRTLSYRISGEKNLTVPSRSKAVEEVLMTVLKNAVENTPDQGQISILLAKDGATVHLRVQDTGVGIIPEEQEFLFDGLYHTQSTELYTSKRPFDFGAGGKGLALLKARLSGEHFNFGLSVESRRCTFLPRDTDQCPGQISECRHCNTIEDCQKSGGTTVSLTFRGPTFLFNK
jgi:signal transduction histidine kinase